MVSGGTTDSLTKVIVANVLQFGGLLKTNLASNLIGFGVDGVSIFQGTKIIVTTQLWKKHAPSCLGCVVLPIIQIL